MPQLQAAPVREQKTRPNRPKRPHRPDDGTGEQSKRTKSDSKKREIKGCRSVLKVFICVIELEFYRAQKRNCTKNAIKCMRGHFTNRLM